ncbi:hypothetical protein [Nocardiopsis coralliicola]
MPQTGAGSGPAADPATLDALLRGAFASALACAPSGLGFTDPRRDPDQRPWAGRFTTAAALRAPGDPAALAGRAAAALRSVPGIRSAEAVGPGFIAFTPEPRLLAALAVRAAEGAAFLTAGAWRGMPDPGGRWGPAGPDDALPVPDWPLTGLAGSGPVAQARADARSDAACAAQDAAGAGAAAGAGGTAPPVHPAHAGPPAASPAPEERDDWREPAADALAPAAADTPLGPTALLLAAVGENAARYAFCRAADDQPRPGELTGPDLPAEPTADRPGAWARATPGNPAFAVRLAHARAAASRDGLFSSGIPPFAAGGGPASRAGLQSGQGAGPRSGSGPGDGRGSAVADTLGGAREDQGRTAGRGSRAGQHDPGGEAPQVSGGAEPGGPCGAPASDPLLDPAAWDREPELAEFAGALYDGPGVLRGAGRRGRPHMLVRYVEGLAAAYTAVGPSRSAAADAAAAGVLGAALRLLGVSAPTRP